MEGISLLLCTSVNGLINTPSPILDLSELIYPSNVLFMINTQIKPKIVEARRGSWIQVTWVQEPEKCEKYFKRRVQVNRYLCLKFELNYISTKLYLTWQNVDKLRKLETSPEFSDNFHVLRRLLCHRNFSVWCLKTWILNYVLFGYNNLFFSLRLSK